MLVLLSAVALRYYNCCTDGSTIPVNYGYHLIFNFVSVLQEPAENIIKLRTTPPLFQAYEYAYSLLENSLCPLFHESDDVSDLVQKHYKIEFLVTCLICILGPLILNLGLVICCLEFFLSFFLIVPGEGWESTLK
jgi:hypothetical protein